MVRNEFRPSTACCKTTSGHMFSKKKPPARVAKNDRKEGVMKTHVPFSSFFPFTGIRNFPRAYRSNGNGSPARGGLRIRSSARDPNGASRLVEARLLRLGALIDAEMLHQMLQDGSVASHSRKALKPGQLQVTYTISLVATGICQWNGLPLANSRG